MNADIRAWQYEDGTLRIIYVVNDIMYVAACEDLNGMKQFLAHSCSNRMDGSDFHSIARMHNSKHVTS